MILPNTKKVIYLNAGHSLHEKGAQLDGFEEFIETMEIRNRCVPLFKEAGFEIQAVPDDLRLRESIVWVNQRALALNDGLAIDIHLNFMSDPKARGTEAFYGTSSTSRKIAEVMSREVSEALGIPNRGAKPDTASFIGELGWIRKTNCWANLVEICFLSSEEDMAILLAPNGYEKAAQGIVNACKIIFGIEEDPRTTILQKIAELIEFLKAFLLRE